MKLLFLFCSDPAIDPVAPHVLKHIKAHYAATPTSLVVGDKTVFHALINGSHFYFADTRHVASGLYPEIAEQINAQFPDVKRNY